MYLQQFMDSQHNNFYQQGYLIKNREEYEIDLDAIEVKQLKDQFNYLEKDKSPGSRYRAYLKLIWNKESDLLSVAEDQTYYQTYLSNKQDGGKIREFQMLNPNILKNKIFKKITEDNLKFIGDCSEYLYLDKLIVGVHFIRYQVEKDEVAFSSPQWLHIDDEPLVFIHLINLSNNMIGGDNVIASRTSEIKGVIRLTHFMDTLLLNQMVRHAVTPMGSTEGVAMRDIILFTVEPTITNQRKMK